MGVFNPSERFEATKETTKGELERRAAFPEIYKDSYAFWIHYPKDKAQTVLAICRADGLDIRLEERAFYKDGKPASDLSTFFYKGQKPDEKKVQARLLEIQLQNNAM